MLKIKQVVIFRNREVHTGGERYLAEIHGYLERQDVKVIPVWVDDLPRWPQQFGLIVDCLVSNFWFFIQVRKSGDVSDALFFEDFHMHPRLWLFNILIRLVYGKQRIVILMQSSLFYHDALENSIARRLDEWVVRLFFNQAGMVLCNSAFTQTEAVLFGVPRAKTSVVYCGYDGTVPPFSARRHTIPDGKRHLLFVGQCVPLKGIEYLIQALTLLEDKGIVLDIVGNIAAEPEYFRRLTMLVDDLGVGDKVVFHGSVKDKSQLYRFYKSADAFVLPSLIEGFGIVLLEAMFFGLPIIASNVGAIPELLKDGVNGLLVPPANPVALASAIDRLLAMPELAENYGQAGYAFITEHREFYQWDAVGDRILQALGALYREKEIDQ